MVIRKSPFRTPVNEKPTLEQLYPGFLTWEEISGEPIKRVLALLHDLSEMELLDFFNVPTDEMERLSPAELMSGRLADVSKTTEAKQRLLALPHAVRLDMVCQAAERYHVLVFAELASLKGAAGDAEKRSLLVFRRAHERLLKLTEELVATESYPGAAAALADLRRFNTGFEEFISKAQNEPDPTVYWSEQFRNCARA